MAWTWVEMAGKDSNGCIGEILREQNWRDLMSDWIFGLGWVTEEVEDNSTYLPRESRKGTGFRGQKTKVLYMLSPTLERHPYIRRKELFLSSPPGLRGFTELANYLLVHAVNSPPWPESNIILCLKKVPIHRYWSLGVTLLTFFLLKTEWILSLKQLS